MNEFYNIGIHDNITKEQTWGPIDDTKPKDIPILYMAKQISNKGTQHNLMHLLLYEFVGSWLNPSIIQSGHLLLL
jgi:hypothetical protein